MPTGAAVRRTVLLLSTLAACFVLAAPALHAAQVEITSPGPLTRVIISDELNCQVAHRDDASFEFFPSSDRDRLVRHFPGRERRAIWPA